MQMSDFRSLQTVVLLILFIGIWLWAWSRSSKSRFKSAANSLFDEKDEKIIIEIEDNAG